LEPGRAGQRERAGKKGGPETGPNPTDRGKAGTKHHILVDREGVPLAVELTAANVHDSVPFEPMLDKVPSILRSRGRPRKRPAKLHADKAYDHRRCRLACRRRGILPRIARRGIESSERLGRYRWVVERAFAWLYRLRRLVIRYERRADIHRAFLVLGVCLIAFKYVTRFY
jgi:transposase